jgi:heme oxygenase
MVMTDCRDPYLAVTALTPRTSMPATTDDTTETFSAAIRAASWSAHGDAEQAPYLTALTSGELDLRGYGAMVAQHHYAYEVLEAAADAMRDDPIAGPFVDDALTRGPALVADLVAIFGPNWADEIAPSAATQAYCDRLREVCFTWAGGFVAHHYVRYLGDLSGGQYIRSSIERTYGIDAHSGTAFYEFADIADPTVFKDAYRARIDAAPWDAEERSRIVAEILLGYRHNTDVLLQLP